MQKDILLNGASPMKLNQGFLAHQQKIEYLNKKKNNLNAQY